MSHFKSLALAAVALAASSAFADVVTYSANVTPSGVIFGTGGVANGGFTVSQDSTIGLELGLRARVRFDNITLDQGNGTYGNFATSPGPLALWNFDFAINSNYNGNGANLSANGLTYQLGLDFDPATGDPTTAILNLSTTCIDSQFGNNSTPAAGGVVASCSNPGQTYTALMAGNNVAQNSGNLGWFAAPFGQMFNASASGEYTFFLQAVNAQGIVVGRSDITVDVGTGSDVPEPASLALVALALGGLGVSRRRKTKA